MASGGILFEVILASVGYAGGIIANKFALSKFRVPVMRFIPLLFIWLAIVTAIFMPRFGGFEFNLFFQWRLMVLFILMIVVAVTWNIFFYQGIQKESLHEFELIMLFTPLATITLATIFLSDERNMTIIIPGLIASSALIISRFRHHHVHIGKTAWKTIIAMFLISLESILIKGLLVAFTPVSLYFVRTLVIAAVFLIMYRPKLLAMSSVAFFLVIISAIFGAMQMILKFYGFENLGVIETTMILVLGPFLVFSASAIFFQERLHKRDMLAATIVVLCVLYVQFWR